LTEKRRDVFELIARQGNGDMTLFIERKNKKERSAYTFSAGVVCTNLPA
jgi:hypothetical protein